MARQLPGDVAREPKEDIATAAAHLPRGLWTLARLSELIMTMLHLVSHLYINEMNVDDLVLPHTGGKNMNIAMKK